MPNRIRQIQLKGAIDTASLPAHIPRVPAAAQKIKIALVGTGMFGGDVHLRAYADLQRSGISPQLGRLGLDAWSRELAPISFELVAVAARTAASAQRAQVSFQNWAGAQPKVYS